MFDLLPLKFINQYSQNICLLLGILCVMSPCGVIIRWSELFCAESKTQVYAVLHDLLSRNENIFEALSKKHSLKLLYIIVYVK